MITHPHVKLNLGLSVLRKRPDGYHDLETLFVPYHGISDTLEIVTGDDWSETSASFFARYAPEEIAQAGINMIRSAFITGEILNINGGAFMRP